MKSTVLVALVVCWLAGAVPALALPAAKALTQLAHDVWQAEQGLPQNYINDLAQTRDGYLWLGTEEGLVRFDGARFTVWIGTNGGGLFRFKDGTMTAPVKTDGLASFIRAIYHDDDGTLWIGTSGGGLLRARPKGADYDVVALTMREGLADDVVYQILDDRRGSLWLSSNKGIARVAKSSIDDRVRRAIDRVEVRLFGRSDGLRSVECNGGFQPAGVRTRDVRLWFPTVRGVVSVAPAQLVTNTLPPPVTVEEVVADESARRVELHYTALSLIEPARVKFQYRLEGLDRAWVDVGNRRVAYYTNVPAGRYVFRVRAANNDGVWNPDGASYAVAVSPRFYETTWFYALCFVAVAAIASSGLRLRARQAVLREEQLTRLVRERTQQLQEANDRLQQLSYHDPLTGIANRRRFEEMLQAEWRRAYRTEQSLAILMIDVDRFKVYNDVFGHQAGDDCLVTVARVLSQSVLRAGDLVARYGGEEFAAILIGTDLGGASDVAGRLRAAVESLGLGHGAERSRPVTVSIGAAAARPRDGVSTALLVGTADRALYQAKNAGRNCVKTARADVE